jgi:hypothetical protein
LNEGNKNLFSLNKKALECPVLFYLKPGVGLIANTINA